MNAIEDDLRNLLETLHRIKQKVRNADPNLYERWRAGGFLTDASVVSMYPSIEKVVELLIDADSDDDSETEDGHDT